MVRELVVREPVKHDNVWYAVGEVLVVENKASVQHLIERGYLAEKTISASEHNKSQKLVAKLKERNRLLEEKLAAVEAAQKAQ
jgi:hypothetical protein